MKTLFSKKIIIISLVIILILSVGAISVIGNYNKYSFKGEVIEANNSALLVLVNPEEDEITSSDKISVSLYNKPNNNFNFKIGDTVEVFYNGVILESYPAMINDVYKIIKIDR